MIQKQRGRRAFFRALHAVADAARGSVRRIYLEIIKQIKARLSFPDLQRAVETGNVEAVVRVINVPGTMENQADGLLSRLRTVIQNAANSTIGQLPKEAATAISFDLLNPRTVQFLRDYRFDLISPVSINRSGQNVGVTQTTLEGIREIIVDAFERGGHPRQQARRIREQIGLSARQAKALQNHRAMLVEEGVKPATIDKRIQKLYDRMLRQRATNIARTETIRAASAGQNAVWDQAAEQGLLDRQTVRRGWVVTPDDRLCPICEAIPEMNPEGVPLGTPFNSTVGPVMHPPAHPQCRCATALTSF